MQHYKNFIDGKWIDSESKETIKVDDPATGKVIGEISCAKKTEVDLAINAARKSYNSRILVDMPLLSRAKLMRKIADETRKVAKEGGELLCYENGKTLGAAVKEFNDVADMFDYYAGLTDKLEGKTIPVAKNVFDYTVLEPFGISAHIVPWNYPLSMLFPLQLDLLQLMHKGKVFLQSKLLHLKIMLSAYEFLYEFHLHK